MKPGDLVLNLGNNGRFDVRIGSTCLVLAVRPDPYGYGPDDQVLEVLMEDGKVIKDLLVHDWMKVISEAG